jgi:Ran GTPase-activating protein (RanGAP) involved in mRNA processing and transport
MFIFIVYDDGREELDNQILKTRTFKHLIKNRIEECEDLEKEIEKIKEEKGMVDEKYHDEVVREQNKEIKRLTQENERNSDRLKEKEQL